MSKYTLPNEARGALAHWAFEAAKVLAVALAGAALALIIAYHHVHKKAWADVWQALDADTRAALTEVAHEE